MTLLNLSRNLLKVIIVLLILATFGVAVLAGLIALVWLKLLLFIYKFFE
jgi:hypothetical protein